MSRIRIKRSSDDSPIREVKRLRGSGRENLPILSLAVFPTLAAVRSAKIVQSRGVLEDEEESDLFISDLDEKLAPPVALFLARVRPALLPPPTPLVAVAPAAPAAAPAAVALRSGEQMYAVRHGEAAVSADRPPISDGRVPEETLDKCMAPFARRWFAWTGTSPVEQRTATRAGVADLARYVALRNKLIVAYGKSPLQYLSVRGAREATGESEISFLVRVWATADYLGLVNFSCDPALAPRQTKRLLDWESGRRTGGGGNDRLAQCDCCGKALHFTAHFARTQEVTLCTRCFGAGRFPHGLTEEQFDRVEDLAMDEKHWTEEETLTLLEAIERFGETDWSAIAQHVKKPIAACLLHFASLPIEDRFTEPILADRRSDSNPFADLDNPVMTLLSFLSSTIHPVVASAAAKRVFDAVAGGQAQSVEDMVEQAMAGTSENAEKLRAVEKKTVDSLFPAILNLQLKKLELKHMRLHKLLPNHTHPVVSKTYTQTSQQHYLFLRCSN